jgi:hypothetical protein
MIMHGPANVKEARVLVKQGYRIHIPLTPQESLVVLTSIIISPG